jgi:acyl transferase domain-containing protein
MKTLDRALADGDRIWSVIRGLGVSSDGRGKSLWAPRKEGQIKAMQRAYRGGLAMGDIEYLEAHATATKLGDATELNTLIELLGKQFPAGKRIPITSVKANIGHALEMAGIAGVIKTCLAMQHETIPPAINIRQLNQNIDWANAPVYVPTSAVPWPETCRRRRDGAVRTLRHGAPNIQVDIHRSEPLLALPAPRSNALLRLRRDRRCRLRSNPAEFWKLLESGRDPKIPLPLERAKKELAFKFGSANGPDPSKLVGGFVTDFEYDWKRHKVPPKQVQQADPLQFMLLEAADQAMQDAGYDKRPFNRENAGVVVGTEFGGDFCCQLQFGLRCRSWRLHCESLARQVQRRPSRKDYSGGCWPLAGLVDGQAVPARVRWPRNWQDVEPDGGGRGGSTSASIGLAALRSTLTCCGPRLRFDDLHDRTKRMAWPFYENLSIMGQLAEGSPRSPLDAAANGVPGEGVVVVLLKRLADAG